jgi:hypothetical protein
MNKGKQRKENDIIILFARILDEGVNFFDVGRRNTQFGQIELVSGKREKKTSTSMRINDGRGREERDRNTRWQCNRPS